MTGDRNPRSRATDSDSARLDQAYDQAVALASRLRDFVAVNGSADGNQLSGEERSRASRATSHLTARLLQIVSWLAAQKAVRGGEISAEQAAGAGCRVAPWDEEWQAVPGGAEGNLSPDLAALVAQGRDLHQRVRELGA